MNVAIGPEQLAAERKHLYLYAMVKLRDADLAEDAVQETLIAAIEALPSFQGRSALRTWLVAILRNKIADLMQARGRLVFAQGEHDGDSGEEELESLFDRHGMWQRSERPRVWEDPEGALQQRQFWKVFEICLRHLPGKTAEVFTPLEVFGEAIESICKNLGITATNCSVMLSTGPGCDFARVSRRSGSPAPEEHEPSPRHGACGSTEGGEARSRPDPPMARRGSVRAPREIAVRLAS